MEESGKCPICLEELKEGETATPDICDHTFCLHCLQKWAKRERVCPVDRKRFKKIIDLSTSAPILIKPRKRKRQPALYDVTRHCEVCSRLNNEETLIICDCCDLSFHINCLTPPLDVVPSGVWNCPMCVAVTENLRAKKGMTKEVENIFEDHLNSRSSSPYSYDSSDEFRIETNNLSNPSPKDEKFSKNSIKLRSLRNRSSLKTNALGNTSNISYNNDASTSRKSGSITFNEHLKKLRPRQTNRSYTYGESSSSSDDVPNSGRKLEESYFLRKRNQNFSTHTDTASTPENLEQCKPLDLTFQEKKRDEFSFSIKSKHSIKNTFPEASITSGELNVANDFTVSDIVIQHTISLKAPNEFSNKTIEEIKTDSIAAGSSVQKDKHFEARTTTDNTGNIKDISEEKLRYSPRVLSDDKNREPGIVPNVKNNEHCNSNFNPNEQSKHKIPTFSVFEKLDVNTSQKKYCDISNAVVDKSHKTCLNMVKSKSNPPVFSPKISSIRSNCDETNSETPETKTLSKELLQMQKNKWKTYHLQSKNKCNCTWGIQWCSKHSENDSGGAVHLLHHNKNSESYSKLLSITRPFIKKPKWNSHDFIILKNIRKKTGMVYSSDNSSSSPNYNPYIHAVKFTKEHNSSENQCSKKNETNSKQGKDIISLKAKYISELKEADKSLLNAVMCVSSNNILAIRSDGTIFVDWKKRKS